MKRPSDFVRRTGSVDFESAMTPMIDVVFLLLVFFVWTASFQVVEQVLNSDMKMQMGSDEVENAEPPPEQDFDNIIVRISWDGTEPQYTINDEPVGQFADVQNHLAAAAKIKVDVPVILHPEGPVPLGHVIQAYDISKYVGFQEVSFAVNSVKN